jgi:hypothetical protein
LKSPKNKNGDFKTPFLEACHYFRGPRDFHADRRVVLGLRDFSAALPEAAIGLRAARRCGRARVFVSRALGVELRIEPASLEQVCHPASLEQVCHPKKNLDLVKRLEQKIGRARAQGAKLRPAIPSCRSGFSFSRKAKYPRTVLDPRRRSPTSSANSSFPSKTIPRNAECATQTGGDLPISKGGEVEDEAVPPRSRDKAEAKTEINQQSA